MDNLIERKDLTRMRLSRIGKILSNFCIVGGVISLLCSAWWMLAGISFFTGFIACVLLFIPWLCSLATDPSWYYSMANFFFRDVMKLVQLLQIALYKIMPYTFGILAAVGALAIVFLSVGKRVSVVRIVIVSMCLLLGVIGMIVAYKVPPLSI